MAVASWQSVSPGAGHCAVAARPAKVAPGSAKADGVPVFLSAWARGGRPFAGPLRGSPALAGIIMRGTARPEAARPYPLPAGSGTPGLSPEGPGAWLLARCSAGSWAALFGSQELMGVKKSNPVIRKLSRIFLTSFLVM